MFNARLLVCFSLIACAYCKIYGFTDGFVMPREVCEPDLDKVECEEQGYFCNGCNYIYSCDYDSSGEKLEGKCFTKCKADTYCSNGKCSPNATEECGPDGPTYVMNCDAPGIFPHPHDCKKYFICSKEPQTTPPGPIAYKSTDYDCPTGVVFDPATLMCSKKAGNCPMPVKLCDGPRIGSIPANPRLYYTCELTINDKYKVKMAYCKDNLMYIAGRCFNPDNNMNINATSTKCTAKGMFHVKNCKQYNECTAKDATPILRTCPVGQKFNITTNPNPLCQELTC